MVYSRGVVCEPCPSPLHPACVAALRAYGGRQADLRQFSPEAEVQRRLDCVAFCCLEALAARPSAQSRKQALQWRALALTVVAEMAGGEELLLAWGRRGAALLARTAALLLAEPLPETPLATRLCFIKDALDCSPGLRPVLAACRPLLHELAHCAAEPQVLHRRAGSPMLPSAATTLQEVLQEMVAELKAGTQGSSRHLTTDDSAASGAGAGLPALQPPPAAAAALREADASTLSLAELAKLVKLALGGNPDGGEAARAVAVAAAATGPVPLELSMRRCRALGLRSCASPRCTDLRGHSEALLRGRRCGGCGAVRYCSDACAMAD